MQDCVFTIVLHDNDLVIYFLIIYLICNAERVYLEVFTKLPARTAKTFYPVHVQTATRIISCTKSSAFTALSINIDATACSSGGWYRSSSSLKGLRDNLCNFRARKVMCLKYLIPDDVFSGTLICFAVLQPIFHWAYHLNKVFELVSKPLALWRCTPLYVAALH